MLLYDLPPMVQIPLELLVAASLGGIIGFEREMHGQAAGFRTYILISLGACLMMQLSQNMETIFRHLDETSTVRVDPGRIASYAIASMGFLGAGAIIKGPSTVRGLTTASGLWLVTGVGLAVGCGFYVPAGLTVVIALIVLYGLRTFKPFFLRDTFIRIILSVDERVFDFREVEKIMAQCKYTRIEFANSRKDLINRSASYNLRLVSRGDVEWRDVTNELMKLAGVKEIAWQERNISV